MTCHLIDAVVLVQSCTADTHCCRQQVPSGRCLWRGAGSRQVSVARSERTRKSGHHLLLVQQKSPCQTGERFERSGTRASGTRSGTRSENRSGKRSRRLRWSPKLHEIEVQGDVLSTSPFRAHRAPSCRMPPNVLPSVGASVRPAKEPPTCGGLPSQPVVPKWAASPARWMGSSAIDRGSYASMRSASRSGYDGTSLMAGTHNGVGAREAERSGRRGQAQQSSVWSVDHLLSASGQGVRQEPGRGWGGEEKNCRLAPSRPSDARGNGWSGRSV